MKMKSVKAFLKVGGICHVLCFLRMLFIMASFAKSYQVSINKSEFRIFICMFNVMDLDSFV